MKLRKMLGMAYKETLMTSQRGNMVLTMVRHISGKDAEIRVSISKTAKSGKPKKPFAVIPLEDFRTADALMMDALKFIVEEARKQLR